MLKSVLLFFFFTLFTFASNTKILTFSLGQESPIQKISFDVLKVAYKKLGYDINIKYYPLERALLTSNAGEGDGELSRIKGIEQNYKNLIPITIPINFIEGYAFSWNDKLDIKNWDSLKERSNICIIGVKFVEKNFLQRGIKCDDVPSITQAVKMLQKKRYETVVLPKINAIKVLKDLGADDISLVGKRLIKINLYHYLHKKNIHLVEKLQDEIAKMEKNGQISELRKKCIKEYKLR